MSNIRDIIRYSGTERPGMVQQAFKAEIATRISSAIEEMKPQVMAAKFNPVAEAKMEKDGIAFEMKKEDGKVVLYADGEMVDEFDSEKEAKKGMELFLKVAKK